MSDKKQLDRISDFDKKAAQALVDCKYAEAWYFGVVYYIGFKNSDSGYSSVDDHNWQFVDPFSSEDQRQALLEWFEVEVEINKPCWTANTMKLFKDDGYIADKRKEAENACLKACIEKYEASDEQASDD